MLESDDVLYLRFPIASDKDEFLDLRRASRAESEPWEPRPAPGVERYDDAAWERFLLQARGGTGIRLLMFRRSDEALLGHIAISQIFRGPFNNGIMGWWCATRHREQGYMTRGVRAALAWAFADEPAGLGLHRVEANIRPENAASLAVARKLRWRYEGFSPRYLQIDGTYRDHCRFALVREDWDFLSRQA